MPDKLIQRGLRAATTLNAWHEGHGPHENVRQIAGALSKTVLALVAQLEALSGGEAVPIEPRTIRNLLAECDALDEGREHDAEQAFDGDRPDLWEPPEVGVSTVILREILRVYLAAPRPMPGREEVADWETIARLVDPEAWALRDHRDREFGGGYSPELSASLDRSRKTAKDILSLFSGKTPTSPVDQGAVKED